MSRPYSLIFITAILFGFLGANGFAKTLNEDWLDKKPADVLVGTDISSIKGFTIGENISSGIYSAEIGGARIKLIVEKKSGRLELLRSYEEPGMLPVNKSYSFKYKSSTIVDEQSISILVTKTGLLVLETKPENDGIPSDIWIFYKKK